MCGIRLLGMFIHTDFETVI